MSPLATYSTCFSTTLLTITPRCATTRRSDNIPRLVPSSSRRKVVGPRTQKALSDKTSHPTTASPKGDVVDNAEPVESVTSMTRNLALEMVRVTESAAVEAARWLGKGDKLAADKAAVDAMREMLVGVDFDGFVIIGEGEKDEAPMLHNGERVGTGEPPSADIAVDPLDGTSLVAQGRNGAVSVIAIADRKTLYDPGRAFYMNKIAVGPEAAGVMDINLPPGENVRRIAKAVGKPVSEVTCVVLDRPRHDQLIADLRATGCRIHLIADGDVAAAIATAWPDSDVDVLMGMGGTPEGVIAAAALRCLGGEIQGKLWAKDEEEAALILADGRDLDAVLTIDDLCGAGEVFFAATGVSDGDLLPGVRFTKFGAVSHSMVLRSKSRTVREIKTQHRWH